MKYYLNNGYGWSSEISKQRFYSLRRSNKWHETVVVNNDLIVARVLKIK